MSDEKEFDMPQRCTIVIEANTWDIPPGRIRDVIRDNGWRVISLTHHPRDEPETPLAERSETVRLDFEGNYPEGARALADALDSAATSRVFAPTITLPPGATPASAVGIIAEAFTEFFALVQRSCKEVA